MKNLATQDIQYCAAVYLQHAFNTNKALFRVKTHPDLWIELHRHPFI
jgi:hypothetical protein